MSTKSSIYKFLRTWNDASRIKRGKIGNRVGSRMVGKAAGKGIGELLK